MVPKFNSKSMRKKSEPSRLNAELFFSLSLYTQYTQSMFLDKQMIIIHYPPPL